MVGIQKFYASRAIKKGAYRRGFCFHIIIWEYKYNFKGDPVKERFEFPLPPKIKQVKGEKINLCWSQKWGKNWCYFTKVYIYMIYTQNVGKVYDKENRARIEEKKNKKKSYLWERNFQEGNIFFMFRE